MIDTIMNAISTALDAEFGAGYTICTEGITQEMMKPCFFISCVNHTTKRFFGKRYFSQNQFLIQYFPITDTDYQGYHSVAERVNQCLEYLDADGLTHGTQMKYEVAEGILQYYVNYDYFLYKVEENEPMEILGLSTSVRNGEG